MARLELKGVRKSFQSLEVIHGIDLTVEDGSFTVFVGPSGFGKSSLLRLIAGLEELTAGEVQIDGARCDHLLPSARGMAMVFQSYAVYPHMSVYENLRFGLANQKLPKTEIDARIRHAAEILRIAELLTWRPSELSGGQSQRVAIGRAIVKEPKAFLFDELLSNLDAELRVKMRSEIVSLHRRLKSTMIYGYPRSGGGDDDGRHDRGPARRSCRTGWQPDRALRATEEPVCRRVPRHPADE